MSDEQNLLKGSVSAVFMSGQIHCSPISRAMPPQSRQSLVRALLKQLPESSSPAVIVVRPDRSGLAPIKTNGHRANLSKHAAYDPSAVFVLELATLVATRDHESVTLMGQAVADALQTVVRDAANLHPLVLARGVFYLLYLLNVSQVSLQSSLPRISLKIPKDHSFIRAPVILHTIAGYDQSILEKASMLILKGLTLCIRESSPLRNEITNTPDFWSIIRSLHTLPEAAGKAFNVVASVVAGQQAAVTADNYKDTVSLLNAFAAAGSIGAVVEQNRDKTARRKEKPTKTGKPR